MSRFDRGPAGTPAAAPQAAPQAARPRLDVYDGDALVDTIRLTEGSHCLGRDTDACDLPLEHASCSRRHARLAKLAHHLRRLVELLPRHRLAQQLAQRRLVRLGREPRRGGGGGGGGGGGVACRRVRLSIRRRVRARRPVLSAARGRDIATVYI